MKYIFYMFLFLNIIAFITTFLDKRKAIKNSWRIPEKTLFLIAAVGGSIGLYIGMRIFRHKTKKLRFSLGIPAIIILQLVAIVYLLQYFNIDFTSFNL